MACRRGKRGHRDRRDGVMINVNRRVAELSGYRAEDLIGKRVGGRLLEEMVFRAKTGSKTVEATLKTAHGKLIPVEVVCHRSTRDCAATRCTPSET